MNPIATRAKISIMVSVVGSLLIAAAQPTRSEVVRFEILERKPFADGKSFGDVGPYERIVGRVHYAIDPRLRQNRAVVDIDLAPKADDGKIHFFGDLFVLAPKDPSRGRGLAFYDVNNRGNKLALRFFNYGPGGNDPSSAKDAGDGFLMRNGITVVWSGWDGELLPGNNRLRLSVPIATDGDRPITGPVRCEIVPSSNTKRTVINWANHGSYRPTAQGIKAATLTHRLRPSDPRVPIPRDQWTLHVSDIESDSPTQLPMVELELPAGLNKGHIYEVIYEGQGSMVHGVCFTGLRDLISAFKHGSGGDNPLLIGDRPAIKRAIGFGVSQSGRFLREFLHSGFNEDEHGRQVFDGLIPHVSGGGLGSFNHRFAQPTRHVAQHDHHDYPADRFPFAYETQTDPLSKQTDGILRRAVATKTAPYVMHTQSAAEYWTRSGSLAHTDPLGRRDSKIPNNVRVYLFGGTQHGPSGFPPSRGDGQQLANPGDYKPFLRSLLLKLDGWTRNATPAPASVYPTITAGTLVDWRQKSTGFPKIPGVRYPSIIQQPPLLDFGPRWQNERIPDRQPPKLLGDYRVLVPKCAPDGNEVGCLSPPEVAVPVATYTGWNLCRADAGVANELVSLRGSYVPLPISKTDRENSGDPRRSLEERYGSLDAYMAQLSKTCDKLYAGGYLLKEDVDRTLRVQRERVAPLFPKIGK